MARSTKHIIHEIYSDVMFELAEDAGMIDQVMADLSAVGQILDEEPEFLSLLTLGRLKEEERTAMIRRVFSGRISGLTLDFLCVLARRNRMHFLNGIGQRYEVLLDQHRNLHRIEVTLAKPPTDEQLGQLEKDLSGAIGARVKLTVDVDPEILGGIVIRKGELVIDNSVRTILDRTVKAVMARSRQKQIQRQQTKKLQ
ncbi:MAG: ATP synthase F1 subunit delta [Planctomycetaceae bacterium]|nr:ATP synthase F1 subunit delta [Planctomycetaceae bacterium]